MNWKNWAVDADFGRLVEGAEPSFHGSKRLPFYSAVACRADADAALSAAPSVYLVKP
jgi:hypothetical protein